MLPFNKVPGIDIKDNAEAGLSGPPDGSWLQKLIFTMNLMSGIATGTGTYLIGLKKGEGI